MQNENFICPPIYHLGPEWKQEADGCHGCIRNELLKWVGTHEILGLNDMSKISQKHGFDRSQPYPKNFLGGSTEGACCKCDANGPNGCGGRAEKWSWIRSECLKVAKMLICEKNILY